MTLFMLLFPIVAMILAVTVLRTWRPVYRGRHVRNDGTDIFKPVPYGLAADGTVVYRRMDGTLTGQVAHHHGVVVRSSQAVKINWQ